MKKLLILLIIALFTVTACAEKEKNNTKQAETKNTDSITIEHALGTETFNETPERIVILEWNYAEDLLALGVQPVGLADVDGFNKWVKIDKELADDVVDVGTRQEPNLEEISKLNPDVIITAAENHEKIQAKLEKIAPTIFYDATSEDVRDDLYKNMIDTFKTTAKLLQKESEAEEMLNQLEEKYTEAAQEIDALNLPTNKFLFTQAFSSNQAPQFRLFTTNSTVSKVLEKVGLENIITNDSSAAWGFIEANVEGLANYQDALFIHAVQKDDPLFENLADNQVWKQLSFVQDDQMYDIGGDTWTFGGVLSAETLVDNLLKALKEE